MVQHGTALAAEDGFGLLESAIADWAESLLGAHKANPGVSSVSADRSPSSTRNVERGGKVPSPAGKERLHFLASWERCLRTRTRYSYGACRGGEVGGRRQRRTFTEGKSEARTEGVSRSNRIHRLDGERRNAPGA